MARGRVAPSEEPEYCGETFVGNVGSHRRDAVLLRKEKSENQCTPTLMKGRCRYFAMFVRPGWCLACRFLLDAAYVTVKAREG